MHRRYSVPSAVLLAAAVCLLVPLAWLGVDRVGNADALNLGDDLSLMSLAMEEVAGES